MQLLRFVPLLAWAATILALSVTPAPPTLDLTLFNWDKFQHAGAYAVLTLLAGYACRPYLRPLFAWLAAGAFAVLYGGLMEIAQGSLSTVRSPEWGDLAADALGAALVLVVVRVAPCRGRQSPGRR